MAFPQGRLLPYPLILKEDAILELLPVAEKRKEAFDAIVSLYKRRLYSIIRKMVISHDDADDVLQEVFIKVWDNLGNFRGGSQLFTWLYRIATNEALNFLRKQKRTRLFSSDIHDALIEMLPVEISPDADEVEHKLQKAILQLPDKQRLVFHLRYYEDLPYEEMATITDTSVGALKASYHHAVKKIEDYLRG
jgi:RNA polymerase sigma factor (sigma-70 family)